MTQNVYPPMSEREVRNAAAARKAASEGMVLLKNRDGALPLDKARPIALFGNGAVRTVRGGTGSGDPFNGGLSGGGAVDVDLSPRYHINILPSMKAAGFEILTEEALLAYAEKYDAFRHQQKDFVMSVFRYPEEMLTGETAEALSQKTDTAVYVISRNSGEGNDRSLLKTVSMDGKEVTVGDYNLCETEKENLALLRRHFKKLVLVLNVPGPISGNDLEGCDPDAILVMGQAGQEGGDAVTDVLSGAVSPSGHLTVTWAADYADYPTAGNFLSDNDTAKYEEGVYVGYRYFSTFGKNAAYPFGYGLSYTDFALSEYQAELEEDALKVSVKVTNTGKTSGREVVQVYSGAPDSEMDMPEIELKGFAKTKVLAPGESETVSVLIPLRRLESYDEEKCAYILSKGDYRISVGVSAEAVTPVARVRIPETAVTSMVTENVLPLVQPLEEKAAPRGKEYPGWEDTPVLEATLLPETIDERSVYADGRVTTYTTDPEYKAVMPYEDVKLVEKKDYTLQDVRDGKVSFEEFVAQLTPEEVADLCVGTGWGTPDQREPVVGSSSESVPGAAGETTHALERMGVPFVVLADGPGGIRITQEYEATEASTGKKVTVYHYCTAWPVGTLLAQSFDPEVLETVGRCISDELSEMKIAILLGPGINIQRDPLCGRNFEYFSEDPLLAGKLAAAIVRGIEHNPGVGACIKHFAANNQETNRNGVDSVVGQRALREIYLKPFEIAVKDAQPASIMTSYNLITSQQTADSYDLCTNIARGEWNFGGLIMTDWNSGTAWMSMRAGNDMMMPGGPQRSANIVMAMKTLQPEFDERGMVRMDRMMPGLPLYAPAWNSFELSPTGEDTILAPLGKGHTAEEKDGKILVDGEPIYVRMNDLRLFFADPAHYNPFAGDVTSDVAKVVEGGKAILYRGRFEKEKRLCLGDVQRCAVHNLKIIANSVTMG